MTQFWCLMRDLKRNQMRQPADIDADVESHRKTKMKAPSSKEGDTEKY